LRNQLRTSSFAVLCKVNTSSQVPPMSALGFRVFPSGLTTLMRNASQARQMNGKLSGAFRVIDLDGVVEDMLTGEAARFVKLGLGSQVQHFFNREVLNSDSPLFGDASNPVRD